MEGGCTCPKYLDTGTRCQWGCDLSNPVLVERIHIQKVLWCEVQYVKWMETFNLFIIIIIL